MHAANSATNLATIYWGMPMASADSKVGLSSVDFLLDPLRTNVKACKEHPPIVFVVALSLRTIRCSQLPRQIRF
jgi:hypothetical protein